MRTKFQLQELIALIDAAPPCEKHGRDELHVCLHCGEAVECADCEPIPCQCRNDE